MSPGRWALASGMFSTRPRMPTALTLALRVASTCIRPATAAAPPMSPFISSMPSAGLRLMPPLSKQTPLPTKASGWAFGSAAPFHWMTASWLSRTLPWPTPSSEPMPNFPISFSPRISTVRPSFSSALTRFANSTG